MRSRLRLGLDSIEVLRAGESATPGGEPLRLTGTEVLAGYLMRFVAHEANASALRAIVARELGGAEVRALDPRELAARAAQLVASRRLKVFVHRTSGIAPRAASRQEVPASVEHEAHAETAREPLTWIEIELRDMADEPVASEAYWVRDPDGRVHEGRLDARGRARIDNLHPGVCEVRFPNLDGEAWEMATAAQPVQPEVDFERLAAVLRAASLDGTAFCEECERRKAARRSTAA